MDAEDSPPPLFPENTRALPRAAAFLVSLHASAADVKQENNHTHFRRFPYSAVFPVQVLRRRRRSRRNPSAAASFEVQRRRHSPGVNFPAVSFAQSEVSSGKVGSPAAVLCID
ncbi:hypothetical protein Droror1_Dr00014907 [Drosera rotundifolia]